MLGSIRAAGWFTAALLLCGLGVAGCGSGGSSSGSTGSLSVRLADAPMPGVRHVYVTFTRVEANGSDGGWRTLLENPAGVEVDLLQLMRTDMELAAAPIPPGHYNQVRFIVTRARLIAADGTEFDVTIPSGFQTGIKVNVDCDVVPGGATALLCDFNVARSFHETPPGSGLYQLQPVIKAVVKLLSGTIVGTVTMDGVTPAAGATVDVYTAGQGMAESSWQNSSVVQADGSFKVWALAAGSYDVKITYTSPDGSTLTATFLNVAITDNADTSLNGGAAVSLAPAP